MNISLIMEYVPFTMLATSILIGATTGLGARSRSAMVTSMIRYMMLLSIGATGIWAFLGHTIFAGTTASFIGWPPSPFQFEVALASLGIGLAGLVGFKQTFNYWLALAIVVSVFYWGAALGHLYQMIFHGNFAAGNVGIVLYMDILIPLLLNFLLVQYKRL